MRAEWDGDEAELAAAAEALENELERDGGDPAPRLTAFMAESTARVMRRLEDIQAMVTSA